MYVEFSSSIFWENSISVAYGDILLLIKTGVHGFDSYRAPYSGKLLLRYPLPQVPFITPATLWKACTCMANSHAADAWISGQERKRG